ncbi:glutathione S-transferase family protein [Rhodospirillales bacterium]|nr:glutathione S-transferase family protein [Rhodospirillales bacterium]
MTTTPIIHHYPQSPASEKVRVFLGLKGIAWRSVIIPRVPPKPLVMPLTGGFRLTPVMQIGADIYCDTFCIIQELENRYPSPSLLPKDGSSVDWAIGAWDDTQLFKTAIAIVFSDGLDHMPPGFAEDRIALYFDGADQNTYFKDKLSENLSIVRRFFAEVDTAVEKHDFIGGASPSVSDALAYYIAWFLRGRFSGGPELIAAFPILEAWESRIREFGYGEVTDFSAETALEEARIALPDAGIGILAANDLGFELGQSISVRPMDDENATTGALITLTDDRVSLLSMDPQVGEVAVNFPRSGYVLAPSS